MLKDYRDWLESEMKLLGNASHHAYSFGQANMAKRALERLDEELARTLYVPLDRAEARRVLTALEAQAQQTTSLPSEFETLREALKTALAGRRSLRALGPSAGVTAPFAFTGCAGFAMIRRSPPRTHGVCRRASRKEP